MLQIAFTLWHDEQQKALCHYGIKFLNLSRIKDIHKRKECKNRHKEGLCPAKDQQDNE